MTSMHEAASEDALRMHDPRVSDIRGRLVDLDGLDDGTIRHTVAVLDALRDWRIAENRLSEASRRYMHLGDSDMRALRFIIVTTDHGDVATPRGIADHLGISSAATTKLLDRLERAGHIRRLPHPHDRRSVSIVIDQGTREAAQATVGREHARRFHVAAALTPAERDVVIRFLGELSRTTEGDWSPDSA